MRGARAAGFTLVEVLVALGILGVIVAIVGTSLSGALSVQEAANRRAEMTHAGRTAIDRMSQELLSAFALPAQGGRPQAAGFLLEHRELEGASRDRLSFLTYGRPRVGGRGPSSDMALVEYELVVSDDRRDWRLVRRQADRLDVEALAQAPGDVVAERVVGFEVKVYDPGKKEWVNEWTDKARIPQAVWLTVRLVPQPSPDAERPWGNGPLAEARVLTYGTRFTLPMSKQ